MTVEDDILTSEEKRALAQHICNSLAFSTGEGFIRIGNGVFRKSLIRSVVVGMEEAPTCVVVILTDGDEHHIPMSWFKKEEE